MDWTKEEILNHYRTAVEYIEMQHYGHQDYTDITHDIAWCETANKKLHLFTNEDQEEIARLNERFRNALIPCLEKADLLNAYRSDGKNFPADYWWWHLE